ncbi:TIR domain-containing protein [Burkholderia cenocepacia]|uniref:TIR domain-containing protein n=1 Tax=Burkholderia cenocepacia TaxID=95486 RepID=UPI0028761526|nr:TIR domain-containing protein [Burkholderia cenocepacia]MDS0850505.1 nucleotide-binding protein [Burkholderia cenocepacia]
MKPRAFIGSSVEGLSIAYAVQQNLVHQVETTVWDQGIFNLSSTTIESLTATLSEVDFGIFVFSPDDTTTIRGETNSSVRDNVLFEMGLFIGKLGRDRVFFLVPEKSEIHIPTDLVGITAGKFDANRQDGSMQAATGPACHQIRTQIEKLGLSDPSRDQNKEPEKPASQEPLNDWLYSFIKDDLDEAQIKIQKEIEQCEAAKKNGLLAWSIYINIKKDRSLGFGELFKFASEHSDNPTVQALVINFLTWEEHYADVASLHSKLTPEVSSHEVVVTALARCHIAAEHPEDAIGLLTSQKLSHNPEYALIVAQAYADDNKKYNALDVLHGALQVYPSHERLRYQFASLAMEVDMWEIAFYLFSTLKFDFPKNQDYWGYFGNCCLSLDLYDSSLSAYKQADELAQQKSGWIAGNIGNLFSNKGLPTEAITYLRRATTLDESSQYAYDRMAGALKKKEEEDKLALKKRTEGKIALQNFAKDREKSLQEKLNSPQNFNQLSIQ